jgi:hypothetical protein
MRSKELVTQKVISFRKDYWMTSFPVEAVYYQHRGSGGHCKQTSQTIHSVEELRDFQNELAGRESCGEWMFVAYYEHDVTV